MRLLTALVFVLLLSSCQQRYWHVKRAKADKTQTARTKEKEKLQADSSALQAYFDSSELTISVQADESDEPRESSPSFVPKDDGSEKEKKAFPAPKPKMKRFIEKAHPKLFQDNNSAYDPLTSKEILLILAIYLIVFMALGILFGLFAYLIFFWLIVQLFFGSISSFFLLLMFILILGIIQLGLTYIIGRVMIRKKLQKEVTDFELLSFFLVFLAVLAAVGYLSRLTGSTITSVLLLIALIWAIIYVILY